MRGELDERPALGLTQTRLVRTPTVGQQATLQLVVLPIAQNANILAAGLALKHQEATAGTWMHHVCDTTLLRAA